MRNDPEYILCAAIWYKDIPLIKPETLEPKGFNPYNVDRGMVFCGWRHANCIVAKSAITGLRDSQCGEHIQGFLTSKNRFVDREEAAEIAYLREQISQKKKELYSEDLY